MLIFSSTQFIGSVFLFVGLAERPLSGAQLFHKVFPKRSGNPCSRKTRSGRRFYKLFRQALVNLSQAEGTLLIYVEGEGYSGYWHKNKPLPVVEARPAPKAAADPVAEILYRAFCRKNQPLDDEQLFELLTSDGLPLADTAAVSHLMSQCQGTYRLPDGKWWLRTQQVA